MTPLRRCCLCVGLMMLACAVQGVIGDSCVASVWCKLRTCKIVDELDTTAVAYGYFNNSLLVTGWDILEIMAGTGIGTKTSDSDIMFAAGFLEGFMTAQQIYVHYQNVKASFFSSSKPAVLDRLRQFFQDQDSWMRTMIDHNLQDPSWRHMGYILAQYDGLVAGYMDQVQRGTVPMLDLFAFQVLNGGGDLLDLMHVVDPESIPNWRKMSKSALMLEMIRHGHCSALVKVLGAFENIFMSHSTWFTYANTMRVYKHYHLNVSDPVTATKRLSFSSYPGFLESMDDFYLLSSGLVILETTNGIYNTSLYQSVVPQALLAWHRVRLANMLADSGKAWASILASYNSGTYNNQYMIIDLKKIKLREAILDGALWVVEQIPSHVSSGDQTDILRTGYWASYNVPFYEDIYNMSGYPDVVKTLGPDASYQLAPRAKIFRRDVGNVKDMASMKYLMQYNDYKEDPYSEGNPCFTICCRGDLLPEGASPGGCYDSKVADYFMALNFTADIISGPTLGTGLKPFRWSDRFNVSHIGLPEVYNFPFITTWPNF